jgi:hypothetical protein
MMRRAIAEGKITRFPQGRKPKLSKTGPPPRRSRRPKPFSDKEIERNFRQRLFEEMEAEDRGIAPEMAPEARATDKTTGQFRRPWEYLSPLAPRSPDDVDS